MVPAERQIGIVTGETTTPDDRALRAALESRGAIAEPIDWQTASWERYDAAVFGAPDHEADPSGFVESVRAAASAGVTLANPAPAVTWNVHEVYLRDLADAGVSVVPTAFVERGSGRALRDVLDERGWTDAVVKPAVGSGVWRVRRSACGPETAVAERFGDRVAAGDQLVQRFEPAIHDGELSLVFLGETFSHAFRRLPSAGGFRTRPDHGGTTVPAEPTHGQIDDARAVVETARRVAGVDTALPYARVDGVVRDGSLRVLDVSVIGPYLGLAWADAAGRLADAVLDEVARGDTTTRVDVA